MAGLLNLLPQYRRECILVYWTIVFVYRRVLRQRCVHRFFSEVFQFGSLRPLPKFFDLEKNKSSKYRMENTMAPRHRTRNHAKKKDPFPTIFG